MTRRTIQADPRVIDLAHDLIQLPPGLMRDSAVRLLAEAIQRTITEWFASMERSAS